MGVFLTVLEGFRFELAPDGRYGSYNKKTKQWDGLVKQLLERVCSKLIKGKGK